MKVYIAGKLGTESERAFLEKITKIAEEIGFETYLPHRDGGLARSNKDIKRIFKVDITENLPNSDIIIACLDGLHIGAGTAWELGFAYAKGIKMIGIKTDEPPSKALDYLSPMILGSLKIISSMDDLEKELKKIKKEL